MNALTEAMRYHAAALDAARPQPRFGVVQSVDPARHLAKVTIQPDNVLSGWLPILAMGAGNGWGIVCPPAIGAQVLLVPLDGDHENLAVLPGAWSSSNLPPAPATTPGGDAAPVEPGELAFVSASGTYIRINQDGSLTVVSSSNVTVQSAGNLTLEGANAIALSAPTITGVGGGGTALPLCTSEVWSYLLSHTHDDPQGGSTSAPIQSAPANPLTVTFKAS